MLSISGAEPMTLRLFLHQAFLKHASELTAFVRGRWPHEPDVADIVQESFLRLSQCSDPDSIQNLRAFLFQTASHLVIDQHRRRAIRERHADPDCELDALADPVACPERDYLSHTELQRFTELLEQLPEIRRHAFVLFRLEGFSHDAIAQRLGISKRASERHVMLAMRHFAKHLPEKS